MDFNKMSEESLKEMQSQIEEALENKKKVLHLEVDYRHNLSIRYGDFAIAFINDEGKCFMMNSSTRRGVYQQWLDDGMPVDDTTVVEWKGREYMLTRYKTLVSRPDPDSFHTEIYDFELAAPLNKCNDDNIKRYSNGTPILY